MTNTIYEKRDFCITLPSNYKKAALKGLSKWVSALRSGRYKQCSGNLYNKGRFCPIGVYEKEITNVKTRLLSRFRGFLPLQYLSKDANDYIECCGLYDRRAYRNLYDHNFGWLPEEVTIYDRQSKLFRSDHNLAYLNDEMGIDFNDMADIIEVLYYDC